MDTKQNNPLLKHFRQPAIYIKLPSAGQYCPEGSVEIPDMGEIPVYPMTTRDEITIRTPDSLINGACVVDIVQSCLPAIKNAWLINSVDIDAALIAIRIASYGHEMEMKSICPHCNHENEFGVDLRFMLEKIKLPDFTKIITIDGLKYKLKPQNYQVTNRVNSLKFEEQKILNQLVDTTIEEVERLKRFRQRMQDLTDLNTEVLANCTEYIQLEDNSLVTDPTFILEYYKNCDSKVIKLLGETFQEASRSVLNDKINVTCNNCTAHFETAVEFDYSNFFGNGF